MKTCPVCKATLFDDMPVCYGCLYRFGSNPRLEENCSHVDGQDAVCEQVVVPADARAPKVYVQKKPQTHVRELKEDQFNVRLETRQGTDPDQSWVIEIALPQQIFPHESASTGAHSHENAAE